MDDTKLNFQLPGFRFHPTEEELLDFYLKKVVSGKEMRFDIIGFLNIYHYEPWDLPGLAKIGEREWYFFVPRDRKHGRPNRTTEKGFWKATGSDRKIFGLSGPKKHLGLKKTLVFYKGRAPRGDKTDWVMNEYRLPDSCPLPKEIVLCKIYRKATSLKVLEARAAMEGEMNPTMMNRSHMLVTTPTSPIMSSTPPTDNSSYQSDDVAMDLPPMESCHVTSGEELWSWEEKLRVDEPEASDANNGGGSGLRVPAGLMELQLPKQGIDWTQDPFLTQLRSPWLNSLDVWTPPYANYC